MQQTYIMEEEENTIWGIPMDYLTHLSSDSIWTLVINGTSTTAKQSLNYEHYGEKMHLPPTPQFFLDIKRDHTDNNNNRNL